MHTLAARLENRRREGTYRELPAPRQLIDFASNDYLGLAVSPTFAEEVEAERRRLWHCGSTGARLLTGNTAYACALEETIAAYHGFETALLYTSGYTANVGLLSAVAQASDVIFYDIGVHASTYDGIALAKARGVPFRHNDVEHLESKLKTIPTRGERYLCVESIYSTDGSEAPLQNYATLAERYGLRLIVDEAHAVGVRGRGGRGASEQWADCLFALIATFGKALGAHGAAILGSRLLKEYLINFSRPWIYTTALPPASLAAIACAYRHLPLLDDERDHLGVMAQRMPGGAHISVVPTGTCERAKELSRHLAEDGFDVRPLLPPTVRQGRACVRLCLHAHNTPAQVDALLKSIDAYKEKTDA